MITHEKTSISGNSISGNSIAGKMMILEGMILLVPLIVIPFYPREAKLSVIFLIPACLSVMAGLFVCRYGKQIGNSSRFVVFSWFYGILLAAVPFLMYGDVTLTQALFESVSGFTTTGLSVLDVEKFPHAFLFYRAFLQYVGGLGFIMTMLLFVQEKDSAVLYQAEGHPDRLMPGIGKTAKVIGTMYGFFLFIGTVFYTIFSIIGSPKPSVVYFGVKPIDTAFRGESIYFPRHTEKHAWGKCTLPIGLWIVYIMINPVFKSYYIYALITTYRVTISVDSRVSFTIVLL